MRSVSRVLVFENALKVSGHRLPYASVTAKSFRECEVTVALPSHLRGNEAVGTYFPGLDIHFFDTAGYPLGLAFSRESARCLKKVVSELEPDHVAIPTADGVSLILAIGHLLRTGGLPKDCSLSICLMRGGWSPSGSRPLRRVIGNLKWWLIERGPWKQLMLIDPLAWSRLRPKPASARQVLLAPDPVAPAEACSREEARAGLGLAREGRLIVSVGNQDRRKGIDLLLDAFGKADLGPDDRLLLAGKIDPSVASILDSMSSDDRLIVMDRYISDREFQLCVLAADLVAVPYRATDRPSGVVSRAICWGRPILATNKGWPGWICEQLDAGTVTTINDPERFAQSIKCSLDASADHQPSERAKQFARYNTQENYHRLWNSVCRDTLEAELLSAPTFLKGS